jgi:hypothetical protein
VETGMTQTQAKIDIIERYRQLLVHALNGQVS